jgi:hypothetical protein
MNKIIRLDWQSFFEHFQHCGVIIFEIPEQSRVKPSKIKEFRVPGDS